MCGTAPGPGASEQKPFHRETSYRRHMRDIHQMEMKTEKQKKEDQRLAASPG